MKLSAVIELYSGGPGSGCKALIVDGRLRATLTKGTRSYNVNAHCLRVTVGGTQVVASNMEQRTRVPIDKLRSTRGIQVGSGNDWQRLLETVRLKRH